MKLRTRLLATFGVVALSTLVVSGVGVVLVDRYAQALYDVGSVRLPSIDGLLAMREAVR
jgi:hypothetical protein